MSQIGIYCYGLSPSNRSQLGLPEHINKEDWLTTAVDEINEKYGAFTVSYGDAKKGGEIVKQKIPFGSAAYFELLLKRA